ncbi:hypothetical protein AB0L59_19745 [Streptomyces sp. NPDC052109]|uniref:hypothetical protein n=1 Tax=Streptomyces sp. NPDC052109 TaxID=3155527 RepID=UPI003446E0E2
MNGNQIQGVIGVLVTLGILVLMILPSAVGAVREWRVDRQLRQAERGEDEGAPEQGCTRSRHGAAHPA